MWKLYGNYLELEGIKNHMGEKFSKESYIDAQVAFFKQNAKANPKLLGVELEHFLLDSESLRSYDYFEVGGQRDLLIALKESGWDILLEEEGNLLGLVKDGNTITLEPGGQVEISLKPFETLEEIDNAYLSVMQEIREQLRPNQMIAGIGYHPVTQIDALSLLPKKRYGMMYDYFKENGAYCHNMMKGTAATQVSIDYKDEADFIKKFRVANYLSPVIASLFDATPFFEGLPTDGRNMRARIWAETDLKRSKLIPGSLTTHFDFREYAKYLLKLPPILLYTEGELIYSEKETLENALEHYTFDDSELEHHLSMVFPDVRLKRFIEIRMPDSLPYPYNLGVPALIKGLFYNEAVLEKYYQKSLNVDDAWVEDQNAKLRLSVETDAVKALKFEMLNDVINVLPGSEKFYLQNVADAIERDGSFTSLLKRIYLHDIAFFRETIRI